jgi:hypothetical protein
MRNQSDVRMLLEKPLENNEPFECRHVERRMMPEPRVQRAVNF